MSITISVEDFLQLVRKSAVIEEERLAGFLRRWHDSDSPGEVQTLAQDMVQNGLLTYFQSEQLLLGKWRGFNLGKYRLLERVGVGGMGQVFLGEHTIMKNRVAIKILPPARAAEPSALGRFYREARAAARLDHPNVVHTHDIDQDGNLHYIVMDYVEGPNLSDVVKRFGPLPLDRAISYTHQIASALDYAQHRKIVHRDIKPGNILIDRRGVARLLDLGLARFVNDHTDQLTIQYDDKVILGTADYIAPEQILDSHGVDIRADIYALGATLYFLLAGQPPFPKGSVSQKLLWHRTEDPKPLQLIRPDLPKELEAIVVRMMAKNPDQRYQSPRQVVLALEPFLKRTTSLPNPAEMPKLSPAASEWAVADLSPGPLADTAITHTAAFATTTETSETPALKSPAKISTDPSPFGPRGVSPWGPPVGTTMTNANDPFPAETPQVVSGTLAWWTFVGLLTTAAIAVALAFR